MRDGELLPLPPKTIDLLLLLVENGGTLVSRDSIREQLWGDTFVEEGNITKNIAVLRSVLRDHFADDPIRTVPKRGYQFVAPILWVEDSQPEAYLSPITPDPIPSPPGILLSARPSPARLAFVACAAIAITAVTSLIAKTAPPPIAEPVAAAAPTRPLTLTTLKPLPSAAPRPVLAVLSPANLSGPSAGWLADSIRELLAADLPTTGNLRLVSDERSAVAEQDLNLPIRTYDGPMLQRIGRRLTCSYALIGTYALDRDQVRLNLELRDTTSAATLATYVKEVPRGRLIPALADAASTFRHALNAPTPKLAAADTLPLDQGLTSLRPYATGLHALRLYHLREAQVSLVEAVKLSPVSALAHVALARTYAVIGNSELAGTEAHLALTNAAALPDESRLAVTAHACSLLSDWAGAIDGYRHLALLRPDDLDYTLALANVLERSGDHDGTLALIRTTASASHNASTDPLLDRAAARAALALRDYETLLSYATAEILHARAIEASSALAEGLVFRGSASLRLAKPEQAVADFVESERLSARFQNSWGQARALDRLAQVQMATHDPSSEETLRRLLAVDESIGDNTGISSTLARLGHLQAGQKDYEAARRSLVRAADLASAMHNNSTQLEVFAELQNLATLTHDEGALVTYATRSLALARASANEECSARAHRSLATVSFEHDDFNAAREHYTQALEIYSSKPGQSSPREVTELLHLLIRVEMAAGDQEAAHKWERRLPNTALSSVTQPALAP
jgi:DNA-binding winged helix-turn-helix (wHTH) protein/tetratricopeptide (TPR) repeat protein/TolB-like protein